MPQVSLHLIHVWSPIKSDLTCNFCVISEFLSSGLNYGWDATMGRCALKGIYSFDLIFCSKDYIWLNFWAEGVHIAVFNALYHKTLAGVIFPLEFVPSERSPCDHLRSPTVDKVNLRMLGPLGYSCGNNGHEDAMACCRSRGSNCGACTDCLQYVNVKQTCDFSKVHTFHFSRPVHLPVGWFFSSLYREVHASSLWHEHVCFCIWQWAKLVQLANKCEL